jgi:predicted Zn-dependent peptidase
MSLSVSIQQQRLENGLLVCVVEDRTVPVVAVNLWYNVGSRNEVVGKTGFAHLFEHLMFQGSANVSSSEHMALMNAVGAQLNATTSFDRTNYFEAVPTGALELALWLEADRMGTMLAALSQENLDNQRDVVKNERRQRYDNVPYGTAWEHLFAMTFPEGHPYHHMPIGSMEDLTAASLDDVSSFFTTYYHPGNAVLTLVGDVDAETGFTLAKRYFGGISAKPEIPPARDGSIAPMTTTARRELRESVPAEAYYSMYRAPADGTPEAEAVDVACMILGGSESSRLINRLVRDDQVAQRISAGLNRLIGGVSVVSISGMVRSGASVVDFESAVLDEIARLGKGGPTDDELAVAKAKLEREFLDQTASCADLADLISQQATQFGDPARLNTIVDRINAVTAEQVQGVVNEWFGADSRAVLTYHLDSAGSAA